MNEVWINADQDSITVDDDEILAGSCSDNEESSSSSHRKSGFMAGLDGVVRLEDGSEQSLMVKRTFDLVMGQYGEEVNVVAIHKITYPGSIGQARMETFRIFSEAVATKCGGKANIGVAWYGGSRNEIVSIVRHGFSHSHCHCTGGIGVHLSHPLAPIDGGTSREADEDGVRHVLYCQVILGKLEDVLDGSDQSHSSSEEFDTGVDNVLAPRNYIFWSAFMNSQILPQYIVSFKSTSYCSWGPPGSLVIYPGLTTSDLLNGLSMFSDSSTMALINKHVNDYLARRITRGQVLLRVRQLAGDELYCRVLKLLTDKMKSGQSF